METINQHILDQQKQVWNKFSTGWKQWDHFVQNFLKPVGEVIIEQLDIKDYDQVLDVATGTGEPGMTIASLAKNGKVTGIDLSENMLAVARENAAALGLKNYEVQVADVQELPFESEHFNAISCRMGFMFFPDMQLAANEMFRVLKTGGKMSTSVFGPADQNPWISTIIGIIGKHVEIPVTPANSPGMFRCSPKGLMTELMANAGFKDVSEQELTGKLNFSSPDQYWEFIYSVTPLVVMLMEKAADEVKNKVREELFQVLSPQQDSQGIALAYAVKVITGKK
ncbi:class I SAM-dependent methyltransferase [Pedobacter sp.]|uniref:class I SAM-dependent methyltransferase n=1 Tax=Pedobacter sp. TaxID=1411316 RepID=UPI003D7FAC52